MAINIATLSLAQLKRAVTIKEQIAALENELAAILGEAPLKASPPTKAPRRGTISAAGRAKIAAAQHARWAREKAKKAALAATTSAPVKSKLSPEGRAKIIAGQKARRAKDKVQKSGK